MITVIENQSLLDIAVQHYGNALAALNLAVANNVSITEVLFIEKPLLKPTSEFNNLDVSKYFEARNQMIATAITLQQIEQTPIIGIGTMIIGNNFIVQ